MTLELLALYLVMSTKLSVYGKKTEQTRTKSEHESIILGAHANALIYMACHFSHCLLEAVMPTIPSGLCKNLSHTVQRVCMSVCVNVCILL